MSEISHSRYLAVILIRLKSSISDTQHSSIRLKSNIPDTRHRNILRTGTSDFKGCLLMMYRMSLTFLAVHQCSRCLRFHVAIVWRFFFVLNFLFLLWLLVVMMVYYHLLQQGDSLQFTVLTTCELHGGVLPLSFHLQRRCANLFCQCRLCMSAA